MNRRRQCESGLAAYTLVELLVVLAILAVVTGIAIPLLSKPLAKSSVVGAAQRLSDDLGTARLWAVEHGTPFVFALEPGGIRYHIGPLGLDRSDPSRGTDSLLGETNDYAMSKASLETDELALNGASSADAESTNATIETGVLEGTLSDDARFLELPNPADARSEDSWADSLATERNDPTKGLATALPGDTTDVSLLTDNNSTIAPELVDSIVFFPDGRSTRSRIELVADGYRIAVSTRSITGGIQIGTPTAVQPSLSETDALFPDNADPNAVDPFATDPRAVDPRATDPRAVDPFAEESRNGTAR